eukprot:1047520-Pleurochrysis_carterae.AAC.1
MNAVILASATIAHEISLWVEAVFEQTIVASRGPICIESAGLVLTRDNQMFKRCRHWWQLACAIAGAHSAIARAHNQTRNGAPTLELC